LAEFEEMTPYELMLYVETFSDMKLAELEEKLTLTWLGEYYHRLKKLPPLKQELKKLKPQEKTTMTDDQMLDMVKMLNVQFGGSVESAETNGGGLTNGA
jgi:hypothetical protein